VSHDTWLYRLIEMYNFCIFRNITMTLAFCCDCLTHSVGPNVVALVAPWISNSGRSSCPGRLDAGTDPFRVPTLVLYDDGDDDCSVGRRCWALELAAASLAVWRQAAVPHDHGAPNCNLTTAPFIPTTTP
jgi:hypothetical protein